MTTTRQQYRTNHSDLRGIARHCASEGERQAKLKDICERRRFWFGDRYADPATPGAQAALRVMMARYSFSDPIALLVVGNAAISALQASQQPKLRKMIHKAALSSLRLSRTL